jgi:MFS family permease
MNENGFKVYGYRWVVLAVFMFINITIQVLWISFAPISGLAANFYQVSDLQIGFLAMSFMIVFVPLSIPVSWVIDTWGFRKAVSIGAVLMGIFGVTRGLAGANFTLVLLSTIGLAAAQPFLLNSWTKMPALWFASEERATAVGMITLSSLIGVALGMAVTPFLIETMSIPTVQLLYGGIAAFSAVLFVILARDTPPTPPCVSGMEDRALMLDGLKNALKVRQFWFFLVVFFIGMGIFNGISTWVENIIRPRGFTPTDAGAVGAVMLLGGIIGAVVIPYFSDKQHKRQFYIMLGVVLAIPWLFGLAFATSFWPLIVSSFALGFFLISTGPVGMQYVAEITYPTPEGTSNGLIQLFGQVSVVFVYVMGAMKSADGSFTGSLMFAVGMLVVSAIFITQLKDPVKGQTPETPFEEMDSPQPASPNL